MSRKIINAKLAFNDPRASDALYSVVCSDTRGVESIYMQSTTEQKSESGLEAIDAMGGLLLPSLCHSHIHLDKCYILEKAYLKTGEFQEALKATSEVKKTFVKNEDDLFKRGDRLIRESVLAGVTVMRAHVEVDSTVLHTCLQAGIKLKERWNDACDVQLCAFMQDPLINRGDKGDNMKLFEEALIGNLKCISAIGSAPYVESSRSQQLENINFILDLATSHGLHVDFHLDYDLVPLPDSNDSEKSPLIYYLIEELHRRNWTASKKTISIGHATRISLFSPSQLHDLRERVGNLPIHFIGLPQSDLYMMGRNHNGCGSSPRGTLNVCTLKRDYQFNISISVNNVGNAFTPQGTPDPLSLCPLGVAIYQDCTHDGCHALVEAISTRAKLAIGIVESELKDPLVPKIGHPADFVILPMNKTLQDAVTNPSYDRITIKGSRVVSWRKTESWMK